MSQKQKLENDYNQYIMAIEHETKKGIEKIREKIEAIKKEATQIGETLESENTDSLNCQEKR